jgi:hypothetical protein
MVLYIVVAVKKHDPIPVAGVGCTGMAAERIYRSYLKFHSCTIESPTKQKVWNNKWKN